MVRVVICIRRGDPSAGDRIATLFATTVVMHTTHGYIDRHVDDQNSDGYVRSAATIHTLSLNKDLLECNDQVVKSRELRDESRTRLKSVAGAESSKPRKTPPIPSRCFPYNRNYEPVRP
jgi:hypothetical protein